MTDAGVDTLKDPYQEGPCEDQDNFKSKRTADGVVISAGFPANVVNLRSSFQLDLHNHVYRSNLIIRQAPLIQRFEWLSPVLLLYNRYPGKYIPIQDTSSREGRTN